MKTVIPLLPFVLTVALPFVGCEDKSHEEDDDTTSNPASGAGEEARTIHHAATATTQARIGGNIDQNQVVNPTTHIAYSATVNVYDKLGNVHSVTINFGERLTGAAGSGTPPEGYSYRSIQILGVTPSFGNLALPGAGGNSTTQIYAEFDGGGLFIRLVGTLTLDGTREITAVGAQLGDTDIAIAAPGTDDVILPVFDSGVTPNFNMFEELTQHSASTDVRVTVNGNPAD